MPTASRYESPPSRLVERETQRFGRFDSAVNQANLLDARYHGLPRFLRRMRLKEWQAIQIGTPRLFVNVALFDAKLMSLMQAKIYDRERGTKTVHEWKLRPFAFAVADQLIDSTTSYRDKRGFMTFRNQLKRGLIEVDFDLQATRDLPRVLGHVDVFCDLGASQVVSLPFPGEGGMYSHKGMFPVEGEITIGNQKHTLSAVDCLALLDDHKGYYPYVMRWDWVTSATHINGLAHGFNLTRNQCRDPERHNENCAWIGDRIGTLPAVEFTRENVGDKSERWTIKDRDGRVDLRFEPTVPGDVRVNALIVDSRYRGPFGRFEGRLEPEGLDSFVVDGWFGMGEDFHLRC